MSAQAQRDRAAHYKRLLEALNELLAELEQLQQQFADNAVELLELAAHLHQLHTQGMLPPTDTAEAGLRQRMVETHREIRRLIAEAVQIERGNLNMRVAASVAQPSDEHLTATQAKVDRAAPNGKAQGNGG